MLTVIVHLEAKNEKDTLSIIHDLGKGVAFCDHPKLSYVKQDMRVSGTEVKPRQRDVGATEYVLEIDTNPSLEKRIRQALSL